jgi:hypothetical protein
MQQFARTEAQQSAFWDSVDSGPPSPVEEKSA